MSTQSFSSVAVHVVGQYNEAGKHLVAAYRAGAERALGGYGRVADRANGFITGTKLPEQLKTGLVSAQEKLSGFLAQRLANDTALVVKAMDSVAERSVAGIEYVASATSKIESPIGQQLVGALSAIHMPGATLSKTIADKIAEGAKQIEVRVAGAAADVAEVVAPKAKTVRRAVRKS